MRRLTDVTITTDDRPAPPRVKARRSAHAAVVETRAPVRKRRRRIFPGWVRRTIVGVTTLAALAAIAGGGWSLMRSGKLAAAEQAATQRFTDLSLRSGLRVEDIQIEGRKRVAQQDLLSALAIKQGDPILGVDLAAARTRIAALPGVASVTLERRLPGELHVLVVEREPVAIWQNDGRYQLVDRSGQPAGDNIADFPALPLVVGAAAPDHVAALLDMLSTESVLAPRVKASQWVSARRWTITVTGPVGDIEVRLPETDPAAAWHELARLETEQKLLDRKIALIDMRLPDRLVLRIPGGAEQPAKSNPATPLPVRHKAAGRDA